MKAPALTPVCFPIRVLHHCLTPDLLQLVAVEGKVIQIPARENIHEEEERGGIHVCGVEVMPGFVVARGCVALRSDQGNEAASRRCQ